MYNFRLCKFLQDPFSLKKFEIKFIIVDLSPVVFLDNNLDCLDLALEVKNDLM
ncbi:hypothetical protein HNQ06_000998 [Borrelia lanei]|uniref:Uncharacterized protein n=1 Tax=Borreliella lanei TaxID=373540 RepID=A0A7W9ZC10_9SPIR|nr:hypothetical protein [Borreliella lanei]